MASITCDQCGENPAAMILTNIETGDVTSVCGACFPAFVLALAEAIVGTPDSPEKTARSEILTGDEDGTSSEKESHVEPGDETTGEVVSIDPEAVQAESETAAEDPTPPTPKSGRSPVVSSPPEANAGKELPAETTTESHSATKN